MHRDNYTLFSKESIEKFEIKHDSDDRYWSSLISIQEYMEKYTK